MCITILANYYFYFYCILTETAGLAVTYGLSLNMLQGWAIAVLCSLENRMISVERIFQYMFIPSEQLLTISKSRPNCQWPTNGEIELRNLHVCLLNSMLLYKFTSNNVGAMSIID